MDKNSRAQSSEVSMVPSSSCICLVKKRCFQTDQLGYYMISVYQLVALVLLSFKYTKQVIFHTLSTMHTL